MRGKYVSRKLFAKKNEECYIKDIKKTMVREG